MQWKHSSGVKNRKSYIVPCYAVSFAIISVVSAKITQMIPRWYILELHFARKCQAYQAHYLWWGELEGESSKVGKILFSTAYRSDSKTLSTLMLVYHSYKPVFTPKIAIFRRAGGLPLPLAFQYLIFMIWRACDLKGHDIFIGFKIASL